MRRGRHAQDGFTLLELLVVITILGILSAVVVFAVRSSGDKGRSAAVGTEERTIRTALELYCAKYGTYPADVQTLIDAKFLSNTPGYTVLSTGDDPVAFPDGKCPRTPKHYALSLELGNRSPGWEAVARPDKGVAPDDYRNMVQLLDGRIFTGTSIFDPSDGSSGSWKLATPNQLELLEVQPRACGNERLCRDDTPSTMVVLGGATGPCQPDEMAWCGQVLASVGPLAQGGEWELFDPKAPGGGCPAADLGTGNCQPDRGPASSPKDVGQWTKVKANPPPPPLDSGEPDYILTPEYKKCLGDRDFNPSLYGNPDAPPHYGYGPPPDPRACVETRQIPRAVQIRGTNCGANCGKVLMLNSPKMDHAQLWDPKAWAASSKNPSRTFAELGFQDLGQYGTGDGWDGYSDGSLKPLMESLPSGDVLLIAGTKTRWNTTIDANSGQPLGVRDYYTQQPVVAQATAQMFRSSTGTFALLANQPTSRLHSSSSDETALLPDGRVMFTSNYATAQAWFQNDDTIFPANFPADPNPNPTAADQALGNLPINDNYPVPNPNVYPPNPLPPDLRKPDIYNPSTGLWDTPVAPCGVDSQTVDFVTKDDPPRAIYKDWYEKYCYVLSKLPNGGVLAWTGGGEGNEAARYGNSYKGRTYALERTGWNPQAPVKPSPSPSVQGVSYDTTLLPPTGGILITGSACGANCSKVLVLNDRVGFDNGLGGKKLVAELFTPSASP